VQSEEGVPNDQQRPALADDGFVLKDDPPEQLLAAVRTVAGGEALLSRAITKRVIKQFTRLPRPVPPKQLDDLLPGGQHSFDIFESLRFASVIDGVEAFATQIRSHPSSRLGTEPRPAPVFPK
jgi:hypothetical protein